MLTPVPLDLASLPYEPLARARVAARVNSQRTLAHSQLRAWADDARAVVLDTETTDLHGSVIEVAVVSLAGELLLQERARPGPEWPISAEALAVHGLSTQALSGCAPWADVCRRLVRALAGRRVLAFNACYDEDAAARGAPRDCASALKGWGCIMRAAAPLCGTWSATHGGFGRVKLARACEAAGVQTAQLGPAHSAAGDALRAAALVRALAARPPALLSADAVPDAWLPGPARAA